MGLGFHKKIMNKKNHLRFKNACERVKVIRLFIILMAPIEKKSKKMR